MNLFFKNLEGAYAPNTIKAYRSDFEHYAQWCKSNQYEIDDIDGALFSQYVSDMGETLSTATIRRRVASISSVLRLMEKNDPTTATDVVLTLKRIHRKLGRAQKQAAPLTQSILFKLQAVCTDDLLGMRDKLLLQLGYESMRRRSEICAFTFEDIQRLPNGNYALLLRKSKTDQYGEGKIIPVSHTLKAMIDEWSVTIDQNTGRILRSLWRGHRVKDCLKPETINRVLKRLQKSARLHDIDELSGHSFRVGAAIDLLERGVSLEKIMLRGGWKSETTAMRYLRNWRDDDLLLF